MPVALPNGFGIKHAPFPFMAGKIAGKARTSCACLLRPRNEGYSSPALDLRAPAMGAFRDEPAGRHAARRERLAVAPQRSCWALAVTPLNFSSARCAAAACPGVMEWQ